MINGYTNIGDDQTGRYLDNPTFAPLWAKIAELDVPLYLHPREPLPSQTLLIHARPIKSSEHRAA
ncbi:putative TIM-barrel fold metal-dependent hydrolase [Mycobacterium sp. OTB74]|jgi:2,3-dihydroxybenzoate decarboxylase|nr:putative TIM-barrel fold metal-dependent hydrolase [Mycobacterium sp. OTB74]